jgi:hypothetical protein
MCTKLKIINLSLDSLNNRLFAAIVRILYGESYFRS